MASFDSEEEQIEAIKRWWRENGKSLLLGIVVAAVAVFSWNSWQNNRQATAEQASQLYQQVVNSATATGQGDSVSEQEFSTVESLTEQLKNDYSGTIHARYAALFLARLYVAEDQLDQAAGELNWILDNPDLGLFRSAEQALLLTARLRLARVVLAQGQAERALALLQEVDPGPFAASYAEVEGDAYSALGREEEAREAYERAASSGTNPLVELKLRDFGGGS